MISPPPASYSGASRRTRYSRSPSVGGVPSSKRSKPSSSNDPYDRDHGSKSDQPRLYTSICVKNINPKISDLDIRDLCNEKFSKYGTNSVKIYHRNQERVAFVNFTNCEDARKARHAKTGLIWENMQVLLEPVYYRKTVPAEQPIKPDSSRERSPPPRRQRRPSPPSPSPPPPPVRSRSHHQSSSSRRQRSISPPNSPPPRSSRPPRRPYSPYIPLPPDLVDYVGKSSNRQQRSSPSPVRRHQHKQTSKQQRSRSPNNHRSPSISLPRRNNLDNEPNSKPEPTRSLFVENLERNITESRLKEIFSRYGTIEEIDLKKPTSSSKRPYAFIQYKNMDMAYEARRAMDGQLIGKAECKIGYGKIVPSKYLWVGNIPPDIKRHALEHAFSRYGQIKTLNYLAGSTIAFVTYNDTEDAIKARSKLTGTIQIIDGRVIRSESGTSPSSRRAGFRIDYLAHPTSQHSSIVRSQQKFSNRHESRSSSSSDSRLHHNLSALSTQNYAHSPSNHINNNEQSEDSLIEEVKTEIHSRSPTPPILNTIKQRRSTDHSQTLSLNNLSPPIAGRTFYGPLGSYLSSQDTANVNNINELMILCEQLNASATQSNTALATVYPVQFILKSNVYDSRMHFLAGSPTLASLLLGQPGDLVAAKTELKITQRLHLDPHKLEDLERRLRTSVINALSIIGNTNNISDGLILNNNRKQSIVSNQTKFALLITSPKIYSINESSNDQIKNEINSPYLSNDNNKHLEIKIEKMDDGEDELSLSHLISYLSEKEAAGVISIPFYPTYYNDHSSRQETAVLHIFPSCEFSKKMLKLICPSIYFSSNSQTIDNDEHLMVVIVHSD